MSLRKVPSLNLNDYLSKDSAVRKKFVADLYSSFKEYGFVVLNNHTVPKELMAKAYVLQQQMFDLPVEEKMKYFMNNGGQRGYTPFGTERAKGEKVEDLKEFFHVGRDNQNLGLLPNQWPEGVPEFKETFLEIYSSLESAGDLLLEAFGEAIGVLPGYFKAITKDGNSVLRLLHYPPVPEGAKPSAIRAKKHTDINLITLLVAGSTSGLQLLDKTGDWLPVDSDVNNLVVNMGDMLSRMCGGGAAGSDGVPSTVHQVINPDPSKNVSRLSLPMFIHPRSEVVLSCLPQFQATGEVLPDITAGEFLEQRLREIGLKK